MDFIQSNATHGATIRKIVELSFDVPHGCAYIDHIDVAIHSCLFFKNPCWGLPLLWAKRTVRGHP